MNFLSYIFFICVLVYSLYTSSASHTFINSQDEDNYNDLNRIRRNAVSVIDTLMKSQECEKFSSICHAYNGLDFLICANKYKNGSKILPVTCLLQIKNNIFEFFKGSYVKDVADSYCSKDWENLQCGNRMNRLGDALVCMIDNIAVVRNDECVNFIQRLKILPFFNLDTMMIFMGNCRDDINKLQCSKGQTPEAAVFPTLSCLQNGIDQLSQTCRDQILYLYELQADNPNYQRGIAELCEKERNLYCSDLADNNVDQLYQCLILHKEDKHISPKCNEVLFKHEKMVVRDYQVSKGLVKACKEDIRAYQCRKSVSSHKYVRLSQILLCLENASHSGGKIREACKDEMVGHRKLLMEDYRLSPELVIRCQDEIHRLCNRLEEGGKTIHCLMEHSRPHPLVQVSPRCQMELEKLVKEVDVVDNWSVDPILRQACHDVVSIACRNLKPSKVMSCLMEHLGSQLMTEDCETALLQIQYFVARDYKLDPQLFQACHSSAVRLCHAARDWAPGPSFAVDAERGPLVLPCLYRYASLPPEEQSSKKLNGECVIEIKRVMKERALSVELHPEVETACLPDLAIHCVDRTAHRQEITCLQDKLEVLSVHCKEAIYNFTEIQSVHMELNPIIMMNCQQIIESLCQGFLEKSSAGDILECLIEHKNHQLMKYNQKCKAAVDHQQLISLKDYHFTVKFKEACKSYVSRYCSGSRTKAEVVSCLSEVMRNDTLLEHRQKIPKECRQQIRAQLLQSKENIAYNPSLRQACAKEIDKFCSNVTPGNAQVLDCLESHRKELTGNCNKMMFRLEKQDLADSSTDYILLTTCQQMITRYCHNNDSKDALACLKKYKYVAEFDPGCRVIVVRRMIEQYSDYRLNPGLMTGCRSDVAHHCAAVIANQRKDDIELEGKVINCLKNKFRERKLSKECEKRLIVVLQESALNYQLNPLLSTLCSFEIMKLCKKETEKDQLGSGGVEECLKRALLDGKLESKTCKMEVLELIRERKVDIEADPLLHTACLHDITHYCSDIPKGDKRQLNCLKDVLEGNDKARQLKSECKTMLSERLEMYKVEDQFLVENFGELYSRVSQSPSRKYFMVVALTFVGMVFMSGMFCGRVVRRSHVVSKNK